MLSPVHLQERLLNKRSIFVPAPMQKVCKSKCGALQQHLRPLKIFDISAKQHPDFIRKLLGPRESSSGSFYVARSILLRTVFDLVVHQLGVKIAPILGRSCRGTLFQGAEFLLGSALFHRLYG